MKKGTEHRGGDYRSRRGGGRRMEYGGREVGGFRDERKEKWWMEGGGGRDTACGMRKERETHECRRVEE